MAVADAYDLNGRIWVSFGARATRDFDPTKPVSAIALAIGGILSGGNDGANRANILWHDRLDFTGGAVTIDFSALGDGFFRSGDPPNTAIPVLMNKVRVILFHHSSGTSHVFKIGKPGFNGVYAFGSDFFYLYPTGFVAFACPNRDGASYDVSVNTQIQIQESGGGVSDDVVDVYVLGARA